MNRISSGWFVLDKPVGVSSASSVSRVKSLLGVKKSGHAGTLDPQACGVLPIAVGDTCRLMEYIHEQEKEYEFEVVWGKETDTGDSEGIIVGTGVVPHVDEVVSILHEFCGVILQEPPRYSAILVDGVRAYKKARKGEVFSLRPREVYVKTFSLIEAREDRMRFYLSCGKGCYVRSLAVDLAKRLKTLCYVSFLRRLSVGKFRIENAQSFDDARIAPRILAAEYPLSLQKFELSEKHFQSVKNGSAFVLENDNDFEKNKTLSLEDENLYLLFFSGCVVGLGWYKEGMIYPKKVFLDYGGLINE